MGASWPYIKMDFHDPDPDEVIKMPRWRWYHSRPWQWLLKLLLGGR